MVLVHWNYWSDGWMYGSHKQMDRFMDECRHECMDGWMKYRNLDAWIETWIDIISGWIHGRMDGLKDEWMGLAGWI